MKICSSLNIEESMYHPTDQSKCIIPLTNQSEEEKKKTKANVGGFHPPAHTYHIQDATKRLGQFAQHA